jgi:ribosomal protein S18 acetylase RimI-like enzyme
MKIRKAHRRDLEMVVALDMKLADLHHEFDADHRTGRESLGYLRRLYKRLLGRESGVVFLALEGKRLIGFLSGEMGRSDPFSRLNKIAEIEAVYVLPEYRSREVGTALTERFYVWARRRKAAGVDVRVHARNQRGIVFWRKQGFQDAALVLRVVLS